MTDLDSNIKIGVAGWGISKRYLDEIPEGGSHLERYARAFPIVEVTSSFYRSHRRATYERWAERVGGGFRFSVKTPQALTHEAGLMVSDTAVLEQFVEEVGGLREKLAVVLVQLPPGLEFDAATVRDFFGTMRRRLCASVRIVCEPRHVSWSGDGANDCLKELGIARVAADPVRWDGGERPAGNLHLAYFRLHGSPRTYYSDYGAERLRDFAQRLLRAATQSESVWCILDNTAHGHAIANALALWAELLRTGGG